MIIPFLYQLTAYKIHRSFLFLPCVNCRFSKLFVIISVILVAGIFHRETLIVTTGRMHHFMTYSAKGYAIINLPFVSAVKMVIDPMVATKLCPFTSFPATGHTLVSIPFLNYLLHIIFECLTPYPPLVLKVFFVSLFRFCLRLPLLKVRPHCVWFPTQNILNYSSLFSSMKQTLLSVTMSMVAQLPASLSSKDSVSLKLVMV